MFDKIELKIIDNNPDLNYYRKYFKNGIIIIAPTTKTYIEDLNQLRFQLNRTISEKLIIDLLLYNDSYTLIKKMFDEDLGEVNIIFIDEIGKLKKHYTINRKDLLFIMSQIDINCYPLVSHKFNEILDLMSYEKYKDKVSKDIFSVIIDDINYLINVKDIISFMELDESQIEDILKNNNKYCGMSLGHFLYAVNKYYIENKILDNYDVDISLRRKLDIITSSKDVDIQMINQYKDQNKFLINRVIINEELENKILKDLPSNYNDLEKAIYVYIMACKLLTYDEEFYVVNQEGPFAQKHKELENVEKITLSNNKVVCYEFSIIYAHILSKLGINYRFFVKTLYKNGYRGEDEFDSKYYTYGQGHLFLKFRNGKYLIRADAVTSILQGDFIQAKLNQPLKGLVCENINESSKEEYFQTVKKVYSYISSREEKNNEEEKEIQLISSQNLDIIQKVKILVEKVNSSKLVGIDAYSYLLQLRKNLFTPYEQQNNFYISIIKFEKEDMVEALAVISIATSNENGNINLYRYLYKPGCNLVPISTNELQAKFDNNIADYVDSNYIPGIKIRSLE